MDLNQQAGNAYKSPKSVILSEGRSPKSKDLRTCRYIRTEIGAKILRLTSFAQDDRGDGWLRIVSITVSLQAAPQGGLSCPLINEGGKRCGAYLQISIFATFHQEIATLRSQ